MLYCIGVDHRTAVEVRETLALTPSQCAQLLEAVREERIFSEAMVVSTCNRTEFYLVAKEPSLERDLAHLLAHLAQAKAAPLADPALLFRLTGREAVEHLFRVVASLESQIIGEHEIMGQVKEAYRIACQAGTAGFLLHKLLHAAFRAGKRVMTRTQLGQGTASVSQAAVELARQIFSSLQGRTVLLIGAGATAELAVRAAVRAGMNNLVVANRTPERAAALVQSFVQWRREDAAGGEECDEPQPRRRFACPALSALLEPQAGPLAAGSQPPLSAKAISLAEVPAEIAHADLVITAAGAGQPLLTVASVGAALKTLRQPILMIDIAVPRDIEPAVGKLPNVFLADIDALETIVAHNLQQRQAEVPTACAIVADEVEQFMAWLSSRDAVPTIKLLRERIEAIAQGEVERHARKLPPAQKAAFEEFARALSNKLAHDPIAFLNQLGAQVNGDAMATIDTVRRLFHLDESD